MKAPRRIVRTFKPQFATLVESEMKWQTVRPTPKVMPRPGDLFDARQWTGLPYRSKQRKLGEWPIVRVAQCTINSQGVIYVDGELAPKGFAKADGFPSHAALCNWFRDTHGLPFSGILIQWAPASVSSSPSVPSVSCPSSVIRHPFLIS